MSTIDTTTSTTRDLTGVAGQIEFETDTSNVVVNDGSNWRHFRRLGDIQDLADESNILATNTTPPSGHATLVYGADTNNFYVNHDGTWYSFNNDTSEPFADLQSITTTNTESQILSSDPAEYTIEQASDTHNLFVRYNDMWFKYEYIMPNSYSLSFDGSNDYIDCGGASDFGFTDGAGNDSAFTLSAWVKFDSPTAQRILDKSGSTQASRSYLFGTDGANRFSIFLGPYNSAAGDYLYVTESTLLYSGVWYHLVSTYDGSKTAGGLTLYRNGSASTTTDSSAGNYAGMPSTSETLKIGKFNLNGSVMNGLVDEVAVFDYELTSSQVSDLYNSGTPADISSLNPVGWWRMGDDDSGTGTTITDRGSGGNNGTLVNGPTFSSDVPNQ